MQRSSDLAINLMISMHQLGLEGLVDGLVVIPGVG